MPAFLRDDLLAVLRKGQQLSLKFDVFGTLSTHVRADIDERLVVEGIGGIEDGEGGATFASLGGDPDINARNINA
jgi:hypothetical protein